MFYRVVIVLKNIVIVITLLSAGHVHAQVARYVTDTFEISLYGDKGVEESVLRAVPTGARVEVLQSDSDGYSVVRTEDGTEGWVLSRHLAEQPAARDRLAAADKKIGELSHQVNELKSQLADLSAKNAALEKSTKTAGHDKDIGARNVDAGSPEDEQLKGQLLSLQRDLQSMQQENATLQDRSDRDWFLMGTGVGVLGILIGVSLPGIKRQRKRWA